jgi:hypothetical protein
MRRSLNLNQLFFSSGADPTSQVSNHSPQPFPALRRSRNPEKLALPIRSLTLDIDDPYDVDDDDADALSPGSNNARACPSKQGCQIFLGTWLQNRKNVTN